MKKLLLLASVLSLLNGCANRDNSLDIVSIEDMKRVTQELSSDAFLGRMPFTEGEVLSVNYLAEELKNIGFEPAFGDSYFQSVPMVMITSTVQGDVVFNVKGKRISLKAPDQIAVNSPQTTEKVTIESSKMVFAGFGIDSEEWDWNDFEGVDLKGKTVVVMINDPGLYTSDKNLFKGREMTYYGRWTYKYEEAARKGAEAILIIHETEGAGYDFNVPRGSSVTPRFFIDDNGAAKRCSVNGWLSDESARQIFGELGYDIDSLRALSAKRGFRPFEIDATFSTVITNKIVRDSSTNVAGILRGSSSPEEGVVITAHWDHFGVGEPQEGDSIYNGAVDNGTTMAWALEIGRMLSKSNIRPDRSVILLFPTAEEQGLIGSDYYAQNPVISMENTVACLNNDMMVPRGSMNDVTMIGYGYSTLDSLYEAAAEKQGRYLLPDPNSHTGLFFRSDHFPFFKRGVPSIWAYGCYDSKEHGKEWAKQTWDEFIKSVYHRPADNYNPNWDWKGVAEDVALAFDIVNELVKKDGHRPVMK